jgi:hypothetical protein
MAPDYSNWFTEGLTESGKFPLWTAQMEIDKRTDILQAAEPQPR